MAKKKTLPPEIPGYLEVRREKGKIWSHVRQRWLAETPEERVRQEYLCVLVNEYGFAIDQMDEEIAVVERGSSKARADLLVWRSPSDKADGKKPLIVVECKADNVTIDAGTYTQGGNYAQYVQAKFFVTHNNRETKYWKVDHSRMMPNFDEIENIPHADATDKEIEELVSRLKVFKEDEFADLLHKCHNVIRNREKKDPAAAFDEIAKILFVKVYVERELRQKKARENVFTAEFLQQQIGDNPLEDLFQKTKRHYGTDKIFADDEKLNLKLATGLEIVRLLQQYNLSDTSEDIKGIAFERFLGRTFRGEIGQFFTPRTIVEFMIRMVSPEEGDVICDPASGSGGFLIRFFEIVRQIILEGADQRYQEFKATVEQDKKLSDEERAKALRVEYEAIQATIDQKRRDSRLWNLANRRIFGTDANDRMARTSKMNMIMHGDGHGGVHHHDGFLNFNGIFEGRFDIILTNPPFGASVDPDDVVRDEDLVITEERERRYIEEYGDLYREAQARVRAAKGKPIASLFELPKGSNSKIKTEILFIERCLSLLKPGGRLGIVLPEGIFNNPSLAYVREFCEDRAFIRAVVSLPQETFLSSGASVKASLLFLQKFSAEEKEDFDGKERKAEQGTRDKYASEMAAEVTRIEVEIKAAKAVRDAERRKASQKELKEYEKRMEERIRQEARALLKERFTYPIFLYEAEKVGITATGEEDQNELYPNKNFPPGLDKSCLELYREFRENPEKFFLGEVVV